MMPSNSTLPVSASMADKSKTNTMAPAIKVDDFNVVNVGHLVTILNEAANQMTSDRAARVMGVLLRDLSKDYPCLELSARKWENLTS